MRRAGDKNRMISWCDDVAICSPQEIIMRTQPISVEALFSAALEISSPNEREEYLDQACSGDPPLRQRVEALLKANQEAGSFLQHPPAGIDATTEADKG